MKKKHLEDIVYANNKAKTNTYVLANSQYVIKNM